MAKRGRPRIITAENIQKALDNGARNRTEVAEVLGVKYKSLIAQIIRNKIDVEIPRKQISLPGTTRIPSRDRLIARGLSLPDISVRVGVTKEAVRQYINNTEQYEKWRQSRGHFKNLPRIREQAIGDIVSIAQESALRNSGEDEWAARKALEYQSKVKVTYTNSYSFEELFRLFKRYNEAQKDGKKLSLRELSEGTRIWFSHTNKILRKVGLKPMYEPGHYDRTKKVS